MNVLIEVQINTIEERRKALKITIDRMCDLLGIHKNTWRNWRLSKFNDCQVSDLKRILAVLEQHENNSSIAA